ncbi:MAG: proprotein convertase P-domain-containing protein, partial [Bacteroidota bacterium]
MQKANSTLIWAWRLSLGMLLMLLVPILGTSQTFSGAGLPVDIPDSGASTGNCATSVATVTASGTVGAGASIVSVTMDITHTWDSDIEATLISPAGTTLDLTSDNGGSGDNFTNTVFIDGGTPIGGLGFASAPFTGNFEPEGGTFAATFATEEIDGDWTLQICDDAGEDTGTLNTFEITVMGADEPATTPITFCVDLTCQQDEVGFAAQAIAFDFNAFNSGPTPLTGSGNGLWCGTFDLEPGEVRYNFFYAAAAGAGGPEDLSGLNGAPCTSTVNGEVKRSYTVVEGVPETVTFAWESCDALVEECPEEMTDITFCVDFSCEADEIGFAAQGLQASFNNYNSGGFGLTNTGDNIYCRTESLPAGDIRFSFFYASANGAFPEDLTDQPCATDGDGGWQRDYTVVAGQPEELVFAYNSCDDVADCAEVLTDITFCVDFECEAEDVGFAAQGLAASFNGFNSGGSPLTNTMGTTYCRTESLPAGDIRFSFFYASASGAFPEDLTDSTACASVGAGGWQRDYTVVEGQTETLLFAYNSCEEVPDCGPDGAEVEFCVDVTCWPDPVETVNVFGDNFPDGFFNPFGHPMTESSDPGIYCTTVFLPSGPTEYKFLVNGVAEVFEQDTDCTVTTITPEFFRFTNRIIEVEAGVNQSVLFGMDSCDEECSPRSNIEFCVDIGCLELTGSVNVFGAFEPFGNFLFFNTTATPLSDPDEDGIYCATVPLRPGGLEFKFLINPNMPNFVEEQFQPGDPCTITPFGFTNRFITVGEGMDETQNYVFNVPCESTFIEPEVVFEDLDEVCDLGFTFSIAGGATPTGGVYSGTGITDNGDGETFTVDFGVVDPGDLTVTYTLAGELNCVYTETATLPVLDCGTEITDPCTCNDDASQIVFDPVTGGYNNPNDGTFGEVVAIVDVTGAPLPAGLDFRVVAANGAIGVMAGDVLAYDAGAGIYSIAFDHADDVGYTITVDQFFAGNAVGFNFMIGNTCAYPNPVFDPELDPIYCSFQDAITLGGDDTDGIGADAITFTINGAPATAFDPMDLGPGLHEIVMTYDGAADANGGISPDGGTTPAFPGCTQEVVTTIEVEQLAVGCIGNINVTLDEECGAELTPQMVLTGSFDCADDFNLTVDGGNTNRITGCGDHTYMIEVIVEDEVV